MYSSSGEQKPGERSKSSPPSEIIAISIHFNELQNGTEEVCSVYSENSIALKADSGW
jgi:hypothetical protein